MATGQGVEVAKLQVKGWGDFQHYKDRSPPWIKLHKSLLDNYEYQCLPVASRALAPMLWLLASENNDGSFDGDIKKLAFRLRTTEKEVIEGLEPLIQAGFVVSDSDVLAECKRDAMPETEERQRRDREENTPATPNGFADFWSAYPEKVGKGAAESAWKKLKPDLQTVLKAIEAQRKSEKWLGGYIPNPATWLNQKRWLDEVETKPEYRPAERMCGKCKTNPVTVNTYGGVCQGCYSGILDGRLAA